MAVKSAIIVGLVAMLAAAGLPSQAASVSAAKAPTYYDAGNYQVTAFHDGRARGSGLPPTLTRRWSHTFDGYVQNPIIAGGRVFATFGREPDYGTSVIAFDARTGAKAWGPIDLGGTYDVSFLALQNERLFAITFGGRLRAFEAATGRLLWDKDLYNNAGQVTNPITAAHGRVYISEAVDGGVSAVRQSTGTVVWPGEPVGASGSSAAAVATDGTAYIAFECRRAFRFEPLNGLLVWSRQGACLGDGHPPALRGKELWIRGGSSTGDLATGTVLSTATGKVLRGFRSEVPPAFLGGTAVTLLEGRLAGTDAATGKVRWRTAVGGKLSTPPIISGKTAYVGSRSGYVYGYDVTTGKRVWRGSAGAPLLPQDEQNTFYPGMNIGNGVLAVTASQRLTVFA